MTLKEIAEEVGVSISTVSRVVNTRNLHAASIEVQQAIWDCVRKNGYIPSANSRKFDEKTIQNGLDTKPIRVIACIFARNNLSISDNSYFTGVAKCFERTALALNYSTQNYFTAIELNQRNIEVLSGQHLDGVLVIGRHDKSLMDGLSKVVPHIVYAGLARPAGNDYDSVVCDRYEIGVTSARYLMEKGHRKIAYIGETEQEITYDGFKAELQAGGCELLPSMTMNVFASMENGYIGMKNLLCSEARPTAVFCMNDYIAIGAIRALHDQGVKCPEEISVLGVDDIEAAAYTTPKLTTIHTPMEELGVIASKVLIDRIEGGHSINVKVSLPFHMVERESCCKNK